MSSSKLKVCWFKRLVIKQIWFLFGYVWLGNRSCWNDIKRHKMREIRYFYTFSDWLVQLLVNIGLLNKSCSRKHQRRDRYNQWLGRTFRKCIGNSGSRIKMSIKRIISLNFCRKSLNFFKQPFKHLVKHWMIGRFAVDNLELATCYFPQNSLQIPQLGDNIGVPNKGFSKNTALATIHTFSISYQIFKIYN